MLGFIGAPNVGPGLMAYRVFFDRARLVCRPALPALLPKAGVNVVRMVVFPPPRRPPPALRRAIYISSEGKLGVMGRVSVVGWASPDRGVV